MDINEARKQIDEIDAELSELFMKRMKASAEIAEYKKQNNLPVFDEKREQGIIKKICEKSSQENEKFLKEFYIKIFELSRSFQQEIIGSQE